MRHLSPVFEDGAHQAVLGHQSRPVLESHHTGDGGLLLRQQTVRTDAHLQVQRAAHPRQELRRVIHGFALSLTKQPGRLKRTDRVGEPAQRRDIAKPSSPRLSSGFNRWATEP